MPCGFAHPDCRQAVLMKSTFTDLLSGTTLTIQADGEFHEVSIITDSREEAEAILEALEKLMVGAAEMSWISEDAFAAFAKFPEVQGRLA
jgi:hypothetical protein